MPLDDKYDPLAVLATHSFTVGSSGRLLLTRPGLGARPSPATLSDALNPRLLPAPVHIAIAAQLQRELTFKGLQMYSWTPPAAAPDAAAAAAATPTPAPAAAARLFASPNWRTASTLCVLLPPKGMPSGIWSTAASLLGMAAEGCMSTLCVGYLGGGFGGTGVLLLDPWCDSSSSSSAEDSTAAAAAHLASAWEELLSHTSPAAADSAGNRECDILWVAGGSACEPLLALLGDEATGAAARSRTRSVALLQPSRTPAALLAQQQQGASGSASASASASSPLASMLRRKCVAWVCSGSVRVQPPSSSSGLVPLAPTVGGLAAAPALQASAGCTVLPLALTFSAALPQPPAVAEALTAAFCYHASTETLLSFLRHAGEYDTSLEAWEVGSSIGIQEWAGGLVAGGGGRGGGEGRLGGGGPLWCC